MTDWVEDQLAAGKILVRGGIQRGNPLSAKLFLYCLCPTQGVWNEAIGIAEYQSSGDAGSGSSTSVRWISWREDWRRTLRTNPKDLEMLVGPRAISAHRLIMINEVTGPNFPTVLPTGDPRLMIHYGAVWDGIRSSTGSLAGEAVRDSMLPKLVGTINSQLRAWGKVVSIWGSQ